MNFWTQCESAGHGHVAGMADAQPPSRHTQCDGSSRSSAGESNYRRDASRAMNHYIGKCNAGAKPGAECLKDRLLRSKPAREALDTIGCVANFIHLLLDEAARNQWIAPILDPAPQLSDTHQVNAVPDDIHRLSRYAFSKIEGRQHIW